jgi:hypothetical protein
MVSVIAGLALSLQAIPVAEAADTIKVAVASGAARLEGIQNTDGGWFFNVGETDCGAGAGLSCSNTFGVTAEGLLEANKLTPSPALLAAAKDSGNNLSGRGAGCGFDSAGGDTPMRTADVMFLMDLSQIAGNVTYKNAATAFFSCVVGEYAGSGTARGNDRIDRRQLGAWDAAFDIRAALKTGTAINKTFAIAELTRVLQREEDWAMPCAGCDLVTELLGKANLLVAMVPLANATPLIHTKVAEYVADLVAAQQLDGSFGANAGGDGQTQLAAYAILGLKPYASTAALKANVKKGADFLVSQQIAGGGFNDGTGTENTEVDGEVLQALNAAH